MGELSLAKIVENTKKGGKKVGLIIGLSILGVLLIGIAVYLIFGYMHKDEFFTGTMINGTDVSGMTVEQVEKELSDSAAEYVLAVTTKEEDTVEIKAEDISYQYDLEGTVKGVHDAQVWWQWGFSYLPFGPDFAEEHIPTVYDASALETIVAGWDFMQKENQIAPVDSELVYETDKYVVTDHVDGNTIDEKIFSEAVTAAVDNGVTALTVEETGAYVYPVVTSDDPILNDNAAFLNAEANFDIIYNMPDGSTKSIEKENFLDWMSIDEEGRYFCDEAALNEKLSAFVDEMNAVVEASNGSEVTFMSGNPNNKREVTVKCYTNGKWVLDVEGEKAQLAADVLAKKTVTREPVYSSRRFQGGGILGSTYVEIDLSAQHLWYYEDGELKLESDIVSGTYTVPSRRTPGGIYDLDYKQRDRTLRGQMKAVVTEIQTPVEVVVPGTPAVYDELGNLVQEATPDTVVTQMKTEQKVEMKPEYESFVSYWMPFNGGIGMHDATWRGSFGGSYYKYSGSHGCINMPKSKAASLYEMIETNCTVVCYY